MIERLACGIQEVKFAESTETMSFSGYGAVFGNVDSYGDVIQPGAFANTLAEAKAAGRLPAMLLQHGSMGGYGMGDDTPIGKWTALSEDGHGLKVEGMLAKTPRGLEVYELLKMGALDGMSIGYVAKEWEPRSKPEDPRRTLKRVDLHEISLVTFPANRRARVEAVKSIEDLASLSDAEHMLREMGMSKAHAIALVSRIKNLGRSESDPSDGRSDSALVEIAAALARRAQSLTV
jgi:HK97 family phage prohead protease